MDKLGKREQVLVTAAMERLREQGLGVRLADGSRSAGAPRARLTFGGHRAEYELAIRRGLTAATVGTTVHALEREKAPTLIVCDHATTSVAEALRDHEQAFVDTAGNTYLNSPPLLLWVVGRRSTVKLPRGREVGRAFRAKGLLVVFALLCRPEWIELPYREIAKLTGVAHGTVEAVVAELTRLGFVGELAGRRRLLQRGRLLTQWAEAHARVLRPKLVLGRFRSADLEKSFDVRRPQKDAWIGGEVAAARWTRDLQPGSAVVYVTDLDTKLLAARRLKADPDGNVELLRRFWDFECGEPGFAPAPLVYADLVATGDERCLIAARELHERIETRSL